MDYDEITILTEEEFDEIMNKPIKLAYRIGSFLNSEQKQLWYDELKYSNPEKLKNSVHRWIAFNSQLPVLADIKARSI